MPNLLFVYKKIFYFYIFKVNKIKQHFKKG